MANAKPSGPGHTKENKETPEESKPIVKETSIKNKTQFREDPEGNIEVLEDNDKVRRTKLVSGTIKEVRK